MREDLSVMGLVEEFQEALKLEIEEQKKRGVAR